MKWAETKTFLRNDWTQTKRSLFAKPDRRKVVSLLIVGLVLISFRGINELIKAEKMDAEKYAQLERDRQAEFDGIEQAARDMRRPGADETENYRNTVELLGKAGATQSEIKLRLKHAGFSPDQK
ncbi:MAG: hypothetical protein ABSG80_01560 [Verrucomicrobiota bacterium]|jgi:hypothetical protein